MTTVFDLLSRGYFPRELPPPFHTTGFAQAIQYNLASLPNSFNRRRNAKVVCYNLARAGTLRRQLSIPNPILQFNLCRIIEQNWNEINRLIRRSSLSRSIPIVSEANEVQSRALHPLSSLSELSLVRCQARATARFILKADISRFYHTIYTHSIPWAIHGKVYAKANPRARILGNILDEWVRDGQDRQTLGIPIGPDTSLVIAEIILSAVDETLQGRLPSRYRGFRYFDDYELSFATRSEAESALSAIQEILSEYELGLNSQKTEIIELPTIADYTWVSKLRTFNIRSDNSDEQMKDLIEYFDTAFELAKNNPEAHVLTYAVARVQDEQIDQINWELFQHLLMQCLMVEPGTFTPVLYNLQRYYNSGWPPDFTSLSEVMNSQIVYHTARGHGSEVAWAVWSLISFGLIIDNDAANALSRMEDSVVALLSLDAYHRRLAPGLDLTNWQTFMNNSELYDKQWLLCYEANLKGWLPSVDGSDHVSADPNFQLLKTSSVEFYNPFASLGQTPSTFNYSRLTLWNSTAF